MINPLEIKGDALKAWGILRPKLFEAVGFKCEYCGKKTKQLEIHHKDGCGLNNQLENLLVTCTTCHRRLLEHSTQKEAIISRRRTWTENWNPFPSGKKRRELTREYIKSEYDKAFPRAL